MCLMDALLAVQDRGYQRFQRKLIPNVAPETILGVRTPVLRRLARELSEKETYLSDLPHKFFEENQIHAFLLEGEKDFDIAVRRVDEFLPYVDNWATCDQLRPKVFAGHPQELLPYIRRWLDSGHTYTIRFGLEMLLCHYLDVSFSPEYLQWAASVRHNDYYVRMMVAWYFSEALAKQYDAALPVLAEYRLEPWTHNKAIQKAVESYRITPEHKDALKKYKCKARGR